MRVVVCQGHGLQSHLVELGGCSGCSGGEERAGRGDGARICMLDFVDVGIVPSVGICPVAMRYIV